MDDGLLRSAYALQQAGNLAEAARLYDEAVRAYPKSFDALCLLGMAQEQLGRREDAQRSADNALKLVSRSSRDLYNLGCLLQRLSRHEDALASYDSALSLRSDYFEALVHRGLSLLELKRHDEAVVSFERALGLKPGEPGVWFNRGNALLRLGSNDEALLSYDKALSLKPDFAQAWENRGHTLLGMGRSDDAFASYDQAASYRPGQAQPWIVRGNAFIALRRYEDAVSNFDRALALEPQNFEALFQRANALLYLRKPADALPLLDACLDIRPDHPDVWVSNGAAFAGLSRYEEALSCYDRALAFKPDCLEAHVNCAIAFNALKRHAEAAESASAALALKPAEHAALAQRATALAALRRFDQAIDDYERLLQLSLDYPIAGNLVHAYLHCCDWRNLAVYRSAVEQGIRAGRSVVRAFQYVFYCRSAEEQLACTKLWVQTEIAPTEPLWRGERYAHERIRIAYLSEDFRDHAVASLMAGVWEAHDRSKFETFAISLGVDDGSEMRDRVQRSFEHFIDVRDRSDEEIAALLRDREIDIVIDLAGYSDYCRPRILALRPAPVQVNYLGYPATMGAEFVDYIIADRTLIGEADREYYSEKVVYLPDSYMPNDRDRRIAEHRPSRAEAGLPPGGFVFCSFNRAAKLLPETFDIWMRLLNAVPRSILWLADPGRPVAIQNLRREAEARGAAADRLVFAPHLPRTEDHLARLSLADLFLDTEPYNAHATAADALWAGLPVLTLKGETFASRVAASLLNAVGLPEMVTETPQLYENVALMLAREPSTLAALKAKLARNRDTHPLFDTLRFTRQLETAYRRMWERAQSGAQPESFAVEARS